MKSKFTTAFANYLVVTILVLLKVTMRVRSHGLDNAETARAKKGAFILCLWHQNAISALFGFRVGPIVILASRSKAGGVAASFASTRGYLSARGSSRRNNRDRGGQEAKAEMIEALRQGTPAGLTPDGPQGPAKVMKAGVADIAYESGMPVVPVHIEPSRYWQLNTWDDMKIPKPFATINMYYGPAIDAPTGTSPEEKQAFLDQLAEATNTTGPAKPISS